MLWTGMLGLTAFALSSCGQTSTQKCNDGGCVVSDSGVSDGGGAIVNDAGPGESCQHLAALVPSSAIYFVGHGQNADRIRFFLPTTDLDGGTFDQLTVEYWGEATKPSLPLVYDIVPMSYAACSKCIFARTGCALANLSDGGLTLLCEKMYLAQSGTATFNTLGDGIEGVMAGSGANLHLVQWDYLRNDEGVVIADQPIDGGACLNLAGYQYEVTYADYGQKFDAGR